MIRRFSAFGLSARFVIIAASLALAAVGLYSFWTLDIEAYPDPVQPRVEIITQPIGLSAEEVERLTTLPLEIGLSGMRNLESIRSISLFSLSDIKCYFAWDSDYHWDNTETINRLGFINLPQGVTSAISPENPIGEIYRYSAEGPDHNLTREKKVEDWIAEKQLKTVLETTPPHRFRSTEKLSGPVLLPLLPSPPCSGGGSFKRSSRGEFHTIADSSFPLTTPSARSKLGARTIARVVLTLLWATFHPGNLLDRPPRTPAHEPGFLTLRLDEELGDPQNNHGLYL